MGLETHEKISLLVLKNRWQIACFSLESYNSAELSLHFINYFFTDIPKSCFSKTFHHDYFSISCSSCLPYKLRIATYDLE